MAIVAKRTIMSLYSSSNDLYSHQVRIVLAEKGVNVEIFSVDEFDHLKKDLSKLNPYESIPTLVDRELVLYESRIIMEYLDERFPHPPLLPVYPVARAETRKMLHRIEKDWYPMLEDIIKYPDSAPHKTQLIESLLMLEPIFADKPYFLSEEFSLLDCALAPLLWQLFRLNITIPVEAKALIQYRERLFQRESFKQSLSEHEKQERVA